MRIRLSIVGCAIGWLTVTSLAALAQSLPPVCRPLPSDLFSERQVYLDEAHRKLIADLAADHTAERAAATRSTLKKRIAAEGAKSVRAAILEVDLMRLSQAEDADAQIDPRTRARVRRVLERVAAKDRAAAEALAALARHLSEDETEEARRVMIRSALANHRAVFGDMPRQYVLWAELFQLTPEEDTLALAREILAAAERMAVPSITLVAQLAVFRSLPAEHPDKRRLAHVIAEQAMRVVTAPPAAPDSDEPSCYPDMASHTSDFSAALALAGRAEDRKTFVKLVVQHVAASVVFETHAQFILADMSLIVASRSVDFDAYIAAMGRLAIPDCPEGPGRLVCNLVGAAAILSENNRPALALTILRDAERLLETSGATEEQALEVRVALATAEWRHGAKSAAATRAAAVSSERIGTKASSGTRIAYHRLMAEMGEDLLEPVRAEIHFAALIELAIKTANAPAVIKRADDGEEYEQDAPERHAAINAARELVWKHLRRRFCTDCGRFPAAPALRWLAASANLTSPSLEDAALALVAQGVFAKDAPALQNEQPYIAGFRRAAGVNFDKTVAYARSRMKKGASDTAAIRVLALGEAIVASMGSSLFTAEEGPLDENESQTIDAFVRFLAERDPQKLSEIWVDKLGWINTEASGLDWWHDALERAAYLLRASGQQDAAEAVLQFLVEDLENSERDEKDGGTWLVDHAKNRAAFWGSVYAGLAGFNGARRDWKQASLEIDRGQRIVAKRLDDDWVASSDKIGPLIREVRPVLDHLAEMRVMIATFAKGADRNPDKAFEAIQLAMLGETAAGMQASIRRRLTAEPQLAQAVHERDVLIAQKNLAAAFDDTVGAFDEHQRKEELAALTLRADEAGKLVLSMLPASETIGSLKPLPLDEARALLTPGEAVLTLHSGKMGIFASLLDKDGPPLFWVVRMDRQELERRIQDLRRGLDADGRLPPFPLEAAHDLYRRLFGAAEAKLSKAKQLLVLVDGPLVSLPLAVLPRRLPRVLPSTPEQYRRAGIDWLGVSHGFAYLPALRSLEGRRVQRIASRATAAFAAIANPVLEGDPGARRSVDYARLFARRNVADADMLRLLSPLPETELEVRAVAASLGGLDGDLFIGHRARETEIRQNGLTHYRVLMFATHGIMGGELSGLAEPGLVLTPPRIPTALDDGLLTASEVAAMNLDADLVILSACNTASSDGRPRAEGFSGLTRSFLSAGARAVVATHWAILSQPAVQVTTTMIKEHEANTSVRWSEALRRAFAAIVDGEGPASFAHPAAWAAFAVVGAESSRQP